jgi:hypothetical protein
MIRFLINVTLFVMFTSLLGELTVRVFKSVPDIPERYLDRHKIQKFKQGQSGYYTRANEKWNVNKYGWLGLDNIEKGSTISIIGDSFIENIMNPISCNQGSILKQLIPDYSFFEAGRSGITFIEAIEISRILDDEINPKYQLIYLGEGDFYESIYEKNIYSDRLQLSIAEQKIIYAKIKSAKFKKILYNIKLLYFLYLKYPIFVEKQNKGEVLESTKSDNIDASVFTDLLDYSSNNYNLNKLIFVFHPNTDEQIVELVDKYGVKTLLLNSSNDKSWEVSKKDKHWSCYGNNQAGKQVSKALKKLVE